MTETEEKQSERDWRMKLREAKELLAMFKASAYKNKEL